MSWCLSCLCVGLSNYVRGYAERIPYVMVWMYQNQWIKALFKKNVCGLVSPRDRFKHNISFFVPSGTRFLWSHHLIFLWSYHLIFPLSHHLIFLLSHHLIVLWSHHLIFLWSHHLIFLWSPHLIFLWSHHLIFLWSHYLINGGKYNFHSFTCYLRQGNNNSYYQRCASHVPNRCSMVSRCLSRGRSHSEHHFPAPSSKLC